MLIAYNDLANAAGVDGNFGTHSCRIGFVTEALANGVDPITVKNMTGHEALASVARYARPKIDAQKATVRAVLGVEQRSQIK